MTTEKVPFWYPNQFLRFRVAPPVLVIFFTGIVQLLSIRARAEGLTKKAVWEGTVGNDVAWRWVGFICLWAGLSLKVPAKTVLGPETSFGYRPPYKGDGFQYYCFTLSVFLLAQLLWPSLSLSLYDNFPQILGSFNTVAFLLCLILLLKGKFSPQHLNDPIEPRPVLYEFYRGMELHPRVLGIDVKQWTNCRIGLMAWQIFICAFYFTGLQRNGFNMAALFNLLLQTIYIGKFFWWETGYFFTLDMMLDRAGYYICWGCLVWVPCLYTYSSYFIVAHVPSLSAITACVIFIVGTGSIALNYQVDYEKQIFRNSKNYKCLIWDRQASFIKATYKGARGEEKTTALLTSGFWGIGRHINYTFELTAAFAWCAAAGFDQSFWPFLYFIFLTGLLVHRTIRDEEKCSNKYGSSWKTYCKQVPYRLIPYVW